jgi:hypothetical protein
MDSVQQQAQAQGFGEGFMPQEDTRNIIESKIMGLGTHIEQRQQTIDQNRAAIKDHVMEEQDANVLAKPWTSAAKATFGESKKDSD